MGIGEGGVYATEIVMEQGDQENIIFADVNINNHNNFTGFTGDILVDFYVNGVKKSTLSVDFSIALAGNKTNTYEFDLSDEADLTDGDEIQFCVETGNVEEALIT